MSNEATQQTFGDFEDVIPDENQSNSEVLVNGKKKANELDGKTWTQYSISIWSDIRKSQEEIALGHPAIFPVALVSRLIKIFTNKNDRVVFDPFAGVGSTIVAAKRLGKDGVGIELSPKFAEQAQRRCDENMPLDTHQGSGRIINDDSLKMLEHLDKGSVDFVVTSPPYWDILMEKRSADGKEIRNYGDEESDLGRVSDYQQFLLQLKGVFTKVYDVVRDGAYCCVVVMDLRKKEKFFPFHSDIANFMRDIGFIYDDIIIWDRRQEYNNLRPLGYPSVFRVNKVHEFILIFQKPKLSQKSNGAETQEQDLG